MPELPEVETCRRGLSPHIEGKTITSVCVRQRRLRWPIPASFEQAVVGQKIVRIERRAKYLVFHCTEGSLLIHLGMSGYLRWLDYTPPAAKHDHVDFIVDGHCLRYSDPRRFGSILWSDQPIFEHRLLKSLGPEPLSAEFNADYIYQRTRNKKVSIKVWLMDQKNVVGVGNIYAQEALFLAGVSPKLVANLLDKPAAKKIAEEVKSVLKQAIRQGGTTLKDFINSEGKPGYFQQQLAVYGRTGLPCIRCKAPLLAEKMAMRNTVWCPSCQPEVLK